MIDLRNVQRYALAATGAYTSPDGVLFEWRLTRFAVDTLLHVSKHRGGTATWSVGEQRLSGSQAADTREVCFGLACRFGLVNGARQRRYIAVPDELIERWIIYDTSRATPRQVAICSSQWQSERIMDALEWENRMVPPLDEAERPGADDGVAF